MSDLVHELSRLRGRAVRIIGVGNPERGDDGFGVRLAEALGPRLAGGPAEAVDAGTWPERYVGVAAEEGCEAVIFADAARFGAAPGALLFASTAELAARPPAAATHRVPLAVLAQYAEGLGLRAFLLAVEPAVLVGTALSPLVEGTLRATAEVLEAALGPASAPSPCASCSGFALARSAGEARLLQLRASGSDASARAEPVEALAGEAGGSP